MDRGLKSKRSITVFETAEADLSEWDMKDMKRETTRKGKREHAIEQEVCVCEETKLGVLQHSPCQMSRHRHEEKEQRVLK